MRILITGGKGYIAKSLYNNLKDKYEITTISRDDFDLTDMLATNQFFKNKYFDVVIHCAVIGGSRLKKDGWDVLDKNLIMYYNLLQFRRHYTRLIHFGSGAVGSATLGATPVGLVPLPHAASCNARYVGMSYLPVSGNLAIF